MKKIFALVAIVLFSVAGYAQSTETFYDFSALTITHDTLNLSAYTGKKVLVVNTASFCGFTYELNDLVTLDSIYSGPNFAIIGFPCNDFGSQEPYDDSTIQNLYRGSYGVAFQLMHKISIIAPDTAEVYKWLQEQSRNGVANAPVSWNFNKFCIDEAGHWVRHFASATNPLDTAITNWILSPNTTGIASQTTATDVQFLGNPAYHQLNFDIVNSSPCNFKVDLFDMQGRNLQTVFNGMVDEKKSIRFSPANLKTGIYFMHMQSENLNRVFRVCYIN